MLIFVYEYTSGGGASQFCANSLRAEGWAMLSAAVEDFRCIPGVEVVSFLAGTGLPKNLDPSFPRIDPSQEEQSFWQLARKADFTLVIAPEFDDILAQRCQWVEEAGGRLLGPSLAAVRLTADKYELSQFLQEKGVPTPPCSLLDRNVGCVKSAPTHLCSQKKLRQRGLDTPYVLKPRYGAGSLATYVARCPNDLARMEAAARHEGFNGEMILQPLVPGKAASVAFLIGPKQWLVLPAASQDLSEDGRFHYRGGYAPLSPILDTRARRLATRAIDEVPGLLGYVGVDLVLGSALDGSQDYVIEMNPRLTTSYIGLRALSETNLAVALLNIAMGQEANLKWRSGRVQFQSDGRVVR